MGRYAQARKRGSTPPGSGVVPAPVLSYDSGGDSLAWTWAGPTPETWEIYSSVDGETEWESTYESSGIDNTYPGPAAGFYYRVFGADIGLNPVTGTSNVVFVEPH